MGKTLQQLVWAENIVRKTNGRVMILTPLAVSMQTEKEAEKFDIEAKRSRDGTLPSAKIVITNYQQLEKFDHSDFAGCVCDESSILKNFDGSTKSMITEFMKKMSYRLLCTATAAPNDYIELGTSSEALGYLGYVDMLKMFFKNNNNTVAVGGRSHSNMGGKYRFKGHAEPKFWQWVCSWARAIRKPSDLGFDDGAFQLPALKEELHIVKSRNPRKDMLFDLPAIGLQEQRAERSRTVQERCEKAAQIASETDCCISWCHLNRESEILTRLIPDCVEVKGSDPDEKKEESLMAFTNGEVKRIVTKPSIASLGMNWQHCNRQTFFPSHSFEQYYQSVRRSWRFGQDSDVLLSVISTEGEADVLRSLKRKAESAEVMFESIVRMMDDALAIDKSSYTPVSEFSAPSFL